MSVIDLSSPDGNETSPDHDAGLKESPFIEEILSTDTATDDQSCVSKEELLTLLTQKIAGLPDVPKKILALYYFQNMRLAEIAESFGLTESRVCQIHASTMTELRKYVEQIRRGGS